MVADLSAAGQGRDGSLGGPGTPKKEGLLVPGLFSPQKAMRLPTLGWPQKPAKPGLGQQLGHAMASKGTWRHWLVIEL